jgi:hypothetical protein
LSIWLLLVEAVEVGQKMATTEAVVVLVALELERAYQLQVVRPTQLP